MSFADDTSLYISDANTEQLFDKANIEINKLYNWFCSNRLCLNARKTKYMIIRSQRNKCDLTGHNVYINDIAISRIGNNLTKETTNFLGIYFDEYLTCKHHLKYTNNRISSSLFMIKQVKHILPKNILLTLYYSMIQQYITYGLLIWGNAHALILRKTVLLQKRAIRYIDNASYNSHTEPLFKKYNILKLHDQY